MSTVLYEQTDKIVTITINRPEGRRSEGVRREAEAELQGAVTAPR